MLSAAIYLSYYFFITFSNKDKSDVICLWLLLSIFLFLVFKFMFYFVSSTPLPFLTTWTTSKLLSIYRAEIFILLSLPTIPLPPKWHTMSPFYFHYFLFESSDISLFLFWNLLSVFVCVKDLFLCYDLAIHFKEI